MSYHGVPDVTDTGVTGFWNDVAEPRAVYFNGKTYLAWVRDDGHVLVAEYDHATSTLSTPTDLITTVSPFDGVHHNAPSLMVRASDGRIIVAVSEDDVSATPAYFVSTNPEDTSAFGTEQSIGSALVSPTFPTIYQQDDGDIYYWIRHYDDPVFVSGYFKSVDGGATWSAFVPVIVPRTTSAQYHRIGTNGSRFDIFTTDTNRVDTASAIYHFYLDGDDDLYQTDGTLVGAAASGPYGADDGTLVKSAAEGAARCNGWAYDDSGYPACLILVNSGGTTNLVRVARWSGSAWSVTNVVDVGGVIGGNLYTSSGAMDKRNPDLLYIPVKVGSYFELFRYRYDSGTWTGTALTSGSSDDHATPDTPLHARRGLRCLVGVGTFTDDTDFDFTMSYLEDLMVGAAVGIPSSFTVTQGAPVIFADFRGVAGSGVGIPSGFDVFSAGPAQALLAVTNQERPQSTEGGTEGYVLTWHASRKPTWESTAGSTDLDDLSDVTITSAAEGDMLRHDGTAWVNTPGRWEVLLTEDGSEPLTTEDDLDWLYVFVTS